MPCHSRHASQLSLQRAAPTPLRAPCDDYTNTVRRIAFPQLLDGSDNFHQRLFILHVFETRNFLPFFYKQNMVTTTEPAVDILNALFTAIDKSGDNALNLEEMITLCEVGFGFPKDQASQAGADLFKQANKFAADNKVTRMEYTTFMQQMVFMNGMMKDDTYLNDDVAQTMVNGIKSLSA